MPLRDQIAGRVARTTITHPVTDEVIVRENSMISDEAARRIETELNIDAVQAFVSLVTGTNVWNPEVYFLVNMPARLDWAEVMFAAIFGLGAAFLAAIPPAWRAASLDPVEALRYE